MQFELQDLKDMTRCLGVFGILAVTLGCGQVANENEEPARPTEATQLQAPTEQDLSALQAYLDGHDGLLPATYTAKDIFVSHLVSKINDGSFDFDLARVSDAGFGMDAFSLSRKVGGSYEEILLKEVRLWDSYGFLKCKARVERNEIPRAVLASDGRTAVEISVNVILTDVVDAVPSLKNSAFSRTLGYLMRSARTAEKPLSYTATIVVEQESGRFVVASHGSEGQELSSEALQAVIRRNVMTLLSVEVGGLIKKAALMVSFPEGERITLERLQNFDRDRKQAEEKAERERLHAGEMRAAKQTRDSLGAATRTLADAIPSRAAGVQVHVALTREVRDQLRHNALDIELFDAAAHSWELQAAAVRSRPGYSAKQLAKDAAAMIQEFGVATVVCDMEIARPLISPAGDRIQFTVNYRLVSVVSVRPRISAFWVAAATWAALPKKGTVIFDFQAKSDASAAWRIGYALPVGGLLGQSEPALAWGEPIDVLSPQSVLNAANRAVAESLAVDCERALQKTIALSPAERIERTSSLFGGIECLPEAAPKEDGIDLAVLAGIAHEVDSGAFWERRLPGVAAADQGSVGDVLKKLSAVLKPKKWTSKVNERIMASPVYLSDTHVMFDLGSGQQRIGVARDALNDNGAGMLDRIEQIAVDCVVKLNDAARSRDGVQPEQAEAAWQSISKAVRCLVAGDKGESQEAVSGLAGVFASLESKPAAELVRGHLARCAAAAVELDADSSGGEASRRVLQPFLASEIDASSVRTGVVARAEMLLALNDITRCREVCEKAVACDPTSSQLCDYGRITWSLGSALMADGKVPQAVKWLQAANDAFVESRGEESLPSAELLQELGTSLTAIGKAEEGEQALKTSRRVLLLTYGEDDSRVKQFDAAQAPGTRKPAK